MQAARCACMVDDSERREARPHTSEPYPAEKASQGEIILRTPLRKAIFIGGLVGMVLLALILGMLAAAG